MKCLIIWLAAMMIALAGFGQNETRYGAPRGASVLQDCNDLKSEVREIKPREAVEIGEKKRCGDFMFYACPCAKTDTAKNCYVAAMRLRKSPPPVRAVLNDGDDGPCPQTPRCGCSQYVKDECGPPCCGWIVGVGCDCIEEAEKARERQEADEEQGKPDE